MTKLAAFLILVLVLMVGVASAHGGGHRRPPPPPGQGVPPGIPPPPPPPPTITPEDPNPKPKGPTTPPQGPAPAPTPGSPPAPSTPTSKRGRGNVPSSGADQHSWRIWWEYNREYVLGLRRLIRESKAVTITGADKPTRRDPLAHRRDDIRAALRSVVEKRATHPKLKASAFIALGRVGTEAEVKLFLDALEGAGDEDTQAAAALGLGILPAMAADEVRAAIRERLAGVVGTNRSRRVREFAHIAAGLRARHDRMLTMHLARQCASFARDPFDAAVLSFACGITRDRTLLAEVLFAARNASLGSQQLSDLARSHAVAGLGHQRSPLAFDLCVTLLRSRRTGIETRRSAALALGRLLREMEVTNVQRKQAKQTLLKTIAKGRDAALRGYCAIALGGAREPMGIPDLRDAIDRGGNLQLKTYAALALGLAARRSEEKERSRIRRFLATELEKAKNVDLGSALSIAAGLAGAKGAQKKLVSLVKAKGKPAAVRGAAAEALGLLGADEADLLLDALRNGPPELVEGASLGLGLVGRRGLAPELVKRLHGTSAGLLQGSLVIALGRLAESSAVDPLIAMLNDRNEKRVIRELAAVALGLLGDSAEEDALFDLDAYFNYFATTRVTHELLTIF